MTLKEKLELFRSILADNDGYCKKILENGELVDEIRELTKIVETLKIENNKLEVEKEMLKSVNDNMTSISSGDKSKIFKNPSKIVIAKYSLYINRERTHIAPFVKDNVYFTPKGPYRNAGFDVGYVLSGLHDRNLRGLLNEYGELYTYFTDNKNSEYTSNILIYDYLTLPQILNMMDVPVDLVVNGVTLDVIGNAVRFAEARSDELFNRKLPRKRILIKNSINS